MHPRSALCLGAFLAAASAFAHPAIDAQIGDLSRRIAERSRDASLRLQRAGVHHEHGDLVAARRDLCEAIALDDEMDAAHLALARVEMDAGRPGEALAETGLFLARRPGHPEALLTRARAATALRRDDAGAAWTSALDALEAVGRPHVDVYLQASRALGVGVLDRGLSRLGPVPTLMAAGIAIERDAGHFDAAAGRARAAQELAPSPEWSVLEGEALAAAGLPDRAASAFTRALAEIARLPPRARASRWAREIESRARAGVAP